MRRMVAAVTPPVRDGAGARGTLTGAGVFADDGTAAAAVAGTAIDDAAADADVAATSNVESA